MPRTKAESFNRTISGYDGNLDVVKIPVTGQFEDVDNVEEGLKALGDGALDAINAALRAKQISDAIKTASPNNVIDEGKLMKCIKPFRNDPRFASLQDDAQTDAIIAMIKSNPDFLNFVKLAVA